MSTTRRTTLKYLGLGAIVTPIAGLGLIAAMGPGTLERQREAARRDGLPLLPEDLKRTPPVPDEQNAAPLLRELDKLWESKPEKERNAWDKVTSDFNRNPDDPKLRAAFAAGVGKYPDLVRLAERAATRPHCDFAYEWNLVPKLVCFPDEDIVRRFARFFALRARLSTTSEEAFADIAQPLALGAFSLKPRR